MCFGTGAAFLDGPKGRKGPAGARGHQNANGRERRRHPPMTATRLAALVVAGDDGQHALRYASFGEGNSPSAFGHAGVQGQIGWADPATGVSFAYAQNGMSSDLVQAGRRAFILSTHAAGLFS